MITVTQLELSMISPETGNPITANLYEVPGIARQLSISELVMAICLAKATAIEEEIVGRMELLSRLTVNLESLTEAQSQLTGMMVEAKDASGKVIHGALEYISDLTGYKYAGNPFNLTVTWYSDDGTSKTYPKIERYSELKRFLLDADVKIDDSMTKIAEVVQAVSSRIDMLNTTNQKDMIELQSMTNKRDNRYELITNMLKSIGTVLTSITSNLK